MMTKCQKIIIVLNLFWVIFCLCITAAMDYDDCLFESRIAQFFILSSPALLYWSGVWIWGWGFLRRFFLRYRKIIIFILMLPIIAMILFYSIICSHFASWKAASSGCSLISFHAPYENVVCLNKKWVEMYKIREIIKKSCFYMNFFEFKKDDCIIKYVASHSPTSDEMDRDYKMAVEYKKEHPHENLCGAVWQEVEALRDKTKCNELETYLNEDIFSSEQYNLLKANICYSNTLCEGQFNRLCLSYVSELKNIMCED